MSEQDDVTTLGNIELAIQQAMMAARTVTVGKVLAYKEVGLNKSPVVDVQVAPQLPARPVDGATPEVIDIAPLRNVPLSFWQCGEFTVMTPARKGQHVLLIVLDREMQSWMEGDGTTYRPGIPGQHHNLNDVVAFPFLTPESFQPKVRPTTRQLFIGDRTGAITTITMDSGTGSIDIESTATINVKAPVVTLGVAGTPAPIARVGIDFVVVPAGGTGGTFPIVPGPIALPLASAHKVLG